MRSLTHSRLLSIESAIGRFSVEGRCGGIALRTQKPWSRACKERFFVNQGHSFTLRLLLVVLLWISEVLVNWHRYSKLILILTIWVFYENIPRTIVRFATSSSNYQNHLLRPQTIQNPPISSSPLRHPLFWTAKHNMWCACGCLKGKIEF